MSIPTIKIPKKLKSLFEGDWRYRIAYGGRGSGKSWAFAQMLVLKAMTEPNIRILCARELQKSIKDSSFTLIKDTISRLGVENEFDTGESFIRCNRTGSDFLFYGLKHNVDQVKSTERIKYAWVEEAQKLSKASANILTPTVRMEGSEIWMTFNPEDEEDYVSQTFIENTPPSNANVIKINWDDNPWFPNVLDEERLYVKEFDPDNYDYIWNGIYRKIMEGSYYAKQLQQLRENDKITNVPYDFSFPVNTYWDIGISDYTSIWFVQKVGREYWVIDYLQNNGEGVEWYAGRLKEKGYNFGEHILPHDAGYRQFATGKSIKEQLQDIMPTENFTVQARTQSVQADIMATRNFLSKCVFDAVKCEDGLKSLRNYKKKWDDNKAMFLDKPDHDWSSHGADAFRYLATYNVSQGYESPPMIDEKGLPTFNALLKNSNNLKRKRL